MIFASKKDARKDSLTMRMIITILASLVLVFATCKSNRQKARKPDLAPDPTTTFVPDSLQYLLPILDSVWYRDQFYRYDLNSGSSKEQKRKHKEFERNGEKVRTWDRKNLAIVEEIIKKHGWLGPKQVGFRGMYALFLTIQHSDLKTQEKYLPLIKQAAIEKKVTADSYAMLADRVEIKNKRPQIYGTQINVAGKNPEILPLLNPDSVDTWRKSIHLIETMQQYVKRWHIEWDKDAYKNQLPELRKKYGMDTKD